MSWHEKEERKKVDKLVFLDSLLIIRQLLFCLHAASTFSRWCNSQACKLVESPAARGEKRLGVTAEEELQGRERDAAERGENCK